VTDRANFSDIMEPVARALLGEPNRKLSNAHELRWGSRGSFCVDLQKGVWSDHETGQGGGVLDLITREKGLKGQDRFKWLEDHGFLSPSSKPNGDGRRDNIVAAYDYLDENGVLLFQVCRFDPKDFRQRHSDPNKPGEWIWSVKGVRQVPYRLPELSEKISLEQLVFVVEGERDVDRLWSIGVPATCNAGGAGKWKPEHSEHFENADVVIIPDHDPQKRNPQTGGPMFHPDGRPIFPGQDHAEAVALALGTIAKRVRILDLATAWPAMPPKGDISDWLDSGGSAEALYALVEALPTWSPRAGGNGASVAAAMLFDPWERYVVPEFPFHVLPGRLQDYVASQSTMIGCDPSAMAMCSLTAISGAVDHRFAVKMMRGGDWLEHPRLWTLLVGDPSTKKTPCINAATRPLELHEADLRRDYEARLRDYERAKQAKDNTVEKLDPPVRYVVFDTTTEKLGEIISRSEHGLLVKRDELSGWIGSMERYGGGAHGGSSDRGFWLKAYDGGPYGVDRIGRGEIYIPNLSSTLLGGIQPARMAELHGLTSDGLLQRFTPTMMRRATVPRDIENSTDVANYNALIAALIRAPHRRMHLSNDALAAMEELRTRLFKLEQASAGLSDGFQGFVGKLPGLAGRFAVILRMAADPEYPFHEIGVSVALNVGALIIHFIIPHALEFYSRGEEMSGGERLRKIASWLITSKQRIVSSRDFIRNVRCLRGVSVFDLQTRLSPLVAGGWLEPKEPGPANRAWTVTPAVAAQFERQRQIEEERKAVLAQLMGSPRQST
jgi:hypothetical protein